MTTCFEFNSCQSLFCKHDMSMAAMQNISIGSLTTKAIVPLFLSFILHREKRVKIEMPGFMANDPLNNVLCC